jgi:hypothetical protein
MRARIATVAARLALRVRTHRHRASTVHRGGRAAHYRRALPSDLGEHFAGYRAPPVLSLVGIMRRDLSAIEPGNDGPWCRLVRRSECR